MQFLAAGVRACATPPCFFYNSATVALLWCWCSRGPARWRRRRCRRWHDRARAGGGSDTATATQPRPRVSRPACTGGPTYRTTRSRDRRRSRSGSRERKPTSDRKREQRKDDHDETPRPAPPSPDPPDDPPLGGIGGLVSSSGTEQAPFVVRSEGIGTKKTWGVRVSCCVVFRNTNSRTGFSEGDDNAGVGHSRSLAAYDPARELGVFGQIVAALRNDRNGPVRSVLRSVRSGAVGAVGAFGAVDVLGTVVSSDAGN